jgi:cardiolipin synthase
VEVTLLIGVGEFRCRTRSRLLLPALLAEGVRLIEYRKTQLHAKVAVVDDDWATVGSSNCDGLSLFVNQEANIVVRDAAFARHAARQIDRGDRRRQPCCMEDSRQLWMGAPRRLRNGLLSL